MQEIYDLLVMILLFLSAAYFLVYLSLECIDKNTIWPAGPLVYMIFAVCAVFSNGNFLGVFGAGVSGLYSNVVQTDARHFIGFALNLSLFAFLLNLSRSIFTVLSLEKGIYGFDNRWSDVMKRSKRGERAGEILLRIAIAVLFLYVDQLVYTVGPGGNPTQSQSTIAPRPQTWWLGEIVGWICGLFDVASPLDFLTRLAFMLGYQSSSPGSGLVLIGCVTALLYIFMLLWCLLQYFIVWRQGKFLKNNAAALQNKWGINANHMSELSSSLNGFSQSARRQAHMAIAGIVMSMMMLLVGYGAWLFVLIIYAPIAIIAACWIIKDIVVEIALIKNKFAALSRLIDPSYPYRWPAP